jgi:Dullard-like phosphatase family protein
MINQVNYFNVEKTVFFELTDTLVHVTNTNNSVENVKITNATGRVIELNLNIRPHLNEALREIRRNYNIGIFTSIPKIYADAIIDKIDCDGCVNFRLYRDSCIKLNIDKKTVYIKDLRIVENVKLRDMIIVDYSVLAFGLQMENGIPISPFYDDNNDSELRVLNNYLVYLSQIDDVRDENRKYIRLEHFYNIASPPRRKFLVPLNNPSHLKRLNSPLNSFSEENKSKDSFLNIVFLDEVTFSNEFIDNTYMIDDSCLFKDKFIEVLDDLRLQFN